MLDINNLSAEDRKALKAEIKAQELEEKKQRDAEIESYKTMAWNT